MIDRSLDEYWKEAQVLIKAHAKSFVRQLTKDNQCIGEVATALMNADNRWKPDMGTKQSTYRIEGAKMAIWRSQRLYAKHTAKSRPMNPQKEFNPAWRNEAFINEKMELDDRDEVDQILKNDIILRRKQGGEVFKQHFIEGLTIKEIAQQRKTTKQAVSLHITKILKELREFYKKQDIG